MEQGPGIVLVSSQCIQLVSVRAFAPTFVTPHPILSKGEASSSIKIHVTIQTRPSPSITSQPAALEHFAALDTNASLTIEFGLRKHAPH
jgi:hypothetical protein